MSTDKQKAPGNGPQFNTDFGIFCVCGLLAYGVYAEFWQPLSKAEKVHMVLVLVTSVILLLSLATFVYLEFFSRGAKKAKELALKQEQVPELLKKPSHSSCFLGSDLQLQMDVFLPDKIRSRHVHIIGASGSGKTASTILPLIGQDIDREYPVVILDAKGDDDFLEFLKQKTLGDRLKVFDLASSESSLAYNPTKTGTASEAAQRLFNSLIWSQEYFKSKARKIVQKFFEAKYSKETGNPTLFDFSCALKNVESLKIALKTPQNLKPTLSKKDFEELSGLIDQIDQLTTGPLKDLLSPAEGRQAINLAQDIKDKKIIYFRLQSMLDSDSATAISKLVINELANCAAYAQREGGGANFCPVFLDEFASFVCSPFVELISKARSAGFALHFSHQSMGNIQKHGAELASEIVDNSSTRIVMRTYDPDTTEFLAQCFGTKPDVKFTHKIEGSTEQHKVSDVGSLREVQAFAVNPSDIKSLPTGEGYVFVAHGANHRGRGANVFRLTFPDINQEKQPPQKPTTERKNK